MYSYERVRVPETGKYEPPQNKVFSDAAEKFNTRRKEAGIVDSTKKLLFKKRSNESVEKKEEAWGDVRKRLGIEDATSDERKLVILQVTFEGDSKWYKKWETKRGYIKKDHAEMWFRTLDGQTLLIPHSCIKRKKNGQLAIEKIRVTRQEIQRGRNKDQRRRRKELREERAERIKERRQARG